ncbi:MAG: 4-(cytidine 5'-diphospho)-2-C-methyl-D-erythritol kinase [Defluviitaleaceae bacterium]|nr:4-(cytidine 5'-diphospho)-2-C-methyl-D-erythritol kinase [Defluviitaleaceae bacterium]
MNQLQVKAHAKINLALDIINKRSDGYHNLRSPMQSLLLHDTIVLEKTAGGAIALECDNPRIPKGMANLACKAAEKMMNAYYIGSGLRINLRKMVPAAAGLGGGSSNAAAVLRGINELFCVGASNAELAAIGKSIGADVPFCVYGGTMLAEGIGDVLTPLPPHPRISVVLAKPPVEVSTQQVYTTFSQMRVAAGSRPDISAILHGLEASDLREISRGISSGVANMLESVTAAAHPIITELKVAFLRNGAECALMSGSGPTVFAYFKDDDRAAAAARNIRNEMPRINDIFVTSTYNEAVIPG